MMRIFLDANVLVSVLNREYPHFDSCARCLSLSSDSRITLYASSLSLGIAFYFSEKKSGRIEARRKISVLMEHIQVSPCGQEEVRIALQNQKADDFEDALQNSSAVSASCTHILTNNPADYHFSEIPVKRPEEFLRSLY